MSSQVEHRMTDPSQVTGMARFNYSDIIVLEPETFDFRRNKAAKDVLSLSAP